jgi:hypothetical protein
MVQSAGPSESAIACGGRIGLLGWWFPKSLRIVREYSRLYPNGSLLKKQWMLLALAFWCLFVSAWGLKH